MWTNNDHQIVILPPGKGFSTPSPASLKASHCSAPMSETKRRSPPANSADLFHVIHKVPAGDSPYVRAKHVQLIEKDPSRAISLFWSAINAGDRVDSALKDMAIVMKQLNRSDEAIEAIKSFRHLCPHDSQESLDNVLVELYKRAGRIEEEIEMLQSKLKCIEGGVVFGGRRTKTARSQGKKVHITIEEEKSRILGNLAWAYLQLSNYEIAEQYYRRALVFETDRNKECNLAICLMHMNRIAEAKSLLHNVKASSGRDLMDESYSKSFQRACEILNNIEAESRLKHGFKDGNSCWEPRSSPSPVVAAIRREGGQRDDVYRDTRQPREPDLKDGNSYREPRSSPSPVVAAIRREDVQRDGISIYRDMRQPREPGLKDENSYREPRSSPSSIMVTAMARAGGQKVDVYMRQPREFCCVKHFQTMDKPKENLTVLGEISSPCVSYGQGNRRYSQQGVMANEIKNGYFDENSGERMSGMNNYRAGMNGSEPQAGSWHRKTYYSPVPAWSKVRTPFTQPRRCLWGFGDRRQRKVENSNNTEQKFSCDGDWRKRNSWEKNGDLKKSTPEEPNLNQGQLATESQNGESTTETPKPTINTSTKKSWADMAEEEDDEEFFTSCEKFEFYDGWNTEQEFNDENLNCNIVLESPYLQTQMKNVARKLDPFDTRNDCFSSGTHSASPKSQPVKRTLCFDHHQKRGNSTDHNCASPGPRKSLNCDSLNSAQAKGNGSFPGKNVRLLRRNRLKVFEDITRSP